MNNIHIYIYIYIIFLGLLFSSFISSLSWLDPRGGVREREEKALMEVGARLRVMSSKIQLQLKKPNKVYYC